VGTKLSANSRAQLRTIDLHFHDLRQEAGSRWLEAGMPLHHVKELLGHANISQTSKYLGVDTLSETRGYAGVRRAHRPIDTD